MSARTADSPFRETAWDQKLDKMLDDLKTTVDPAGGKASSNNNLMSSYRSSSRNESRTSNRSGVEDGGLMKHHHSEYTSPDKSTKVVSDQYEYESGEPHQYNKKLMKSTYSNYKVSGDLTNDLDALKQGPDPALMEAARSASQKLDSTKGPTQNYSSATSKYSTSTMPNGKPNYDDADYITEESPGGEVRRIVWRNRFEKTFETQDGTPSITIEEEARRRRDKQFSKTTMTSVAQPPPPQLSPGGQPWADPIPMPTPPQVSPRGEPGVAYVYTYGDSSNTSQVQPLPTLGYSTALPATSVPPSEGAPSPTPSGTQPVVYHYSYHYNFQPGQTVPDGVPQPPGGHPHSPPALQMAPASPKLPPKAGSTVPSHTGSSMSYDIRHQKHTRTTTEQNNTQDTRHPTTRYIGDEPSRQPRGGYPIESSDRPKGIDPTTPSDRNVSITINKTEKHTTTSKEFPQYPCSGAPATSTPLPPTGRRSQSTSPDRYTQRYGPGYPTRPNGVTHTYTSHTTHSDSLDRMRKPPHEGLPFPNTSPIKSSTPTKFPTKVDDLMVSFSDSEDGHLKTPNGRSPVESQPLIATKVNSNHSAATETTALTELERRERSKNVSGPPVYYPPGHQALFDESMHTMTLKENKRRGMAKWRNEKESGNKENSSSSDSKGGMAMVPVCLPLCCGAACVLM